MVNVLVPPGGVGIPDTLKDTEVLSAGSTILVGIVVTSTPFTAVPPKLRLRETGMVFACDATILTVVGEQPFTIV